MSPAVSHWLQALHSIHPERQTWPVIKDLRFGNMKLLGHFQVQQSSLTALPPKKKILSLKS